jgi:hypothetical protein
MNNLSLPNWNTAFENLCSRGEKTLEWGLPEQWVHAELFAVLSTSSKETCWKPFRTEIPYLTYYPVTLPKANSRDWRREGAIKWVDICLRHTLKNSWCWFELKVRHAGNSGREDIGSKAVRDAFAKDYVGLCGLDFSLTASVWTDPDQWTKEYWFEKELSPKAKNLRRGTHHFLSAYLQLDSDVDCKIFSESSIRERIETWFQWRVKESLHKRSLPKTTIQYAAQLPGGHSLVLCQSGPVSAVER